MEMKEYAKLLPDTKEEIQEIVSQYVYYSKYSDVRDKVVCAVPYAVAGLYKKYLQDENSNQKRILALQSFLDKYGIITGTEKNPLLQFPLIECRHPLDTRPNMRKYFERSAAIVCEKFERTYSKEFEELYKTVDNEAAKYDDDLDKELRKL